MDGRFPDETGDFTIAGAPDPRRATALLHSREYHAAKHAIMLPIDEFLAMLDDRTSREVADSRSSVEQHMGLLRGLVIAFVLSEAWFGVIFGAFIGLFGLLALMYPEDAFPQKAKELPQRGMPTSDDES